MGFCNHHGAKQLGYEAASAVIECVATGESCSTSINQNRNIQRLREGVEKRPDVAFFKDSVLPFPPLL
jgi:hypothetical protein